MPGAARQLVARALKAGLHRDHVAGREPLLVATVLPQCDQLGRSPHRPHHLVELLLAVAVPERERRKVAGGERGLLPRDRVQRDIGIGDDPLTVLAGDARVILDPLRLKPLAWSP